METDSSSEESKRNCEIGDLFKKSFCSLSFAEELDLNSKG